MMLKADNDDELYAGLCRLRPDILVIGEEVIIELESEDGARLMRQVGSAQEQVALPAG